MEYDAAIIGAGVVGSLIGRELSKYDLNVCLIEKAEDVAMGSSKANSSVIHAGYDANPGSLKAMLNVRGNMLMEKLARELDVPFKRIGSLVLAFNEKDMFQLEKLYQKGIKNHVPDIEILSRRRVLEMEPQLSRKITGALYAPTAGIVSPYDLTVGAVENAVENGIELILGKKVLDIKPYKGKFTIIMGTDLIYSRYVINAAGVYADLISAMVGETEFSIIPRRGEYMLFDKKIGNIVSSIIFNTPSATGKGILATPTVDGNLLIGPNAHDIKDKNDVSTTAEGMQEVLEGAGKLIPAFNQREIITSFAGIRAAPSTEDFIIKASQTIKGFVNAGGIESPGLSAAPAIAEYVRDILISEGLTLNKKKNYYLVRRPVIRFREINDNQKVRIIKEDPRYGNIICRCEKVTEGEIVDCIHRPAGARNSDAVKRRTRAGMGRCQGGFCMPGVVGILARELDIPADKVTKFGGNSRLLLRKTK